MAEHITIKYDTTANWSKAINFIPKAGEIIAYCDYKIEDDITIPGIKIGNGIDKVNNLPFINQNQFHVNNNQLIL